MSPGPARGRPSSFTSLHTAPRRPALAPSWWLDRQGAQRVPPRVSGTRRSEVKEEDRASARAGGHERSRVPDALGNAPTAGVRVPDALGNAPPRGRSVVGYPSATRYGRVA